MVLLPRESARLIAHLSKHVKISPKGIEDAADLVMKGFLQHNFSLKSWKKNELNPQENTLPFTIDWIFLVDTLNFSFWAEKEKEYKISFNGKSYTGYWSLCAAVNRAIEEGYDITSPKFYSDITMDTLKHILRTDTGTEMPMIEERHRILRETGKCLIEKFDSTFATCVAMCKNNAANLLKIIIDNFPSYRDEATIDGHEVSFYKRAQILIGDIWACFEGQECGAFEDINTLTIFADYRIPQLLAYVGTLIYSKELQMKLYEDILIENGHQYEVEIRGCTVWAAELICQKIQEEQMKGEIPDTLLFNSILIDHFLWEYRRNNDQEMEHIPFHKVRCIYY